MEANWGEEIRKFMSSFIPDKNKSYYNTNT